MKMDYTGNCECGNKPLEGSNFGEELQMAGSVALLTFPSDLGSEASELTFYIYF